MAELSAPVVRGCTLYSTLYINIEIGGQGQSGCIRPVCRRSSSELWICIQTAE